jgi:hypothetical protein
MSFVASFAVRADEDSKLTRRFLRIQSNRTGTHTKLVSYALYVRPFQDDCVEISGAISWPPGIIQLSYGTSDFSFLDPK